MELKLSNIAKIESANIKLNGITVIAGNNNTGKSTLGKVVFCLFNSLVNIEEKIERQKEEMIYRLLLRKVEQKPLVWEENVKYKILSPRLRSYARELNYDISEERYSVLINSLMNSISDENSQKGALEELTNEIKKIRSLPIERLSRSAVSAYFNQIFYSEINNKNKIEERAVIDATITDKKLQIEFLDNSCVEMQQQVKILNEAVYLDNPFVLNYLNNKSFGCDEIEQVIIRKLRQKTDAVDDVVQYSYNIDRIQEVLDKIKDVTKGSILTDETQMYFYKENGKEKININNLSAGLKSFIIIKTLLEKGALKEKDILILDEPEIHLHPEWQLIYAEVIVLLHKTFDLTILLTTHSAHFLDALSYYAQIYGMSDKCNYYLSRASQYGCVLEDKTNDLSQIYAQLVDPSIALDKLKYKLEENDEN